MLSWFRAFLAHWRDGCVGLYMARLGLSVGNFERHDGTVENPVARRKERRRPDAILGELLADAEPKTAFGSSGPLDGQKEMTSTEEPS